MEKLKYPIGKFEKPEELTKDYLEKCISVIEQFPSLLRAETHHLTDEQLDTRYRPEGWTVRQVVNHCADSHMNAVIRVKWALTEHKPTIKPYFEDRWAELPDGTSISIEPALNLLDGLHKRWATLLRSLSDKAL